MQSNVHKAYVEQSAGRVSLPFHLRGCTTTGASGFLSTGLWSTGSRSPPGGKRTRGLWLRHICLTVSCQWAFVFTAPLE